MLAAIINTRLTILMRRTTFRPMRNGKDDLGDANCSRWALDMVGSEYELKVLGKTPDLAIALYRDIPGLRAASDGH